MVLCKHIFVWPDHIEILSKDHKYKVYPCEPILPQHRKVDKFLSLYISSNLSNMASMGNHLSICRSHRCTHIAYLSQS